MTYETIPIGNAKSNVSLTATGDSYPGVRALEFSGNFRCYEFAYQIVPAHTEIRGMASHVFLDFGQRQQLAYLLENSKETFEPNMPESALLVSKNPDFMMGHIPAQMQDLRNGNWGAYGISVFRGDNDETHLYAKYDSGGACGERRLYDTMAVLGESDVANLVNELKNGGE